MLETLGAGGEARVVKALDRQHDRFVALKIRPVRDDQAREELLERGADPARDPAASGASAGARGLLRRRRLRRGDGLGRRHRPGHAAARSRAGPGWRRRACSPISSQAAEALTHLHSQVPPVIHGDVKPANLILTKGGRIKLVDFGMSSAPNALRRRVGTPGLPRAGAGRRWRAVARERHLRARGHGVRAADRFRAGRACCRPWEGIDPAQAEQLEAAIRLGMATDPARRPATPGRAGRAPAGRLGRGAADRRGHVLPVGHRGLDRDVGRRAGGDGRGAGAPRRADRRLRRARAAAGSSSRWARATPPSRCSTPRRARSTPRSPPRARCRPSRGRRASTSRVRFGIHTGEAERRGDRLLRARRSTSPPALRGQADGGQIFLSSVTAELVAGHLPDGLRAGRPRPASLARASARRSGSTRSRPRASAPRFRRPIARTAACSPSSPRTATTSSAARRSSPS